jgi:hypothetical protein
MGNVQDCNSYILFSTWTTVKLTVMKACRRFHGIQIIVS